MGGGFFMGDVEFTLPVKEGEEVSLQRRRLLCLTR